MPTDQSLNAVKTGDIIFGIAAGGQEKLLLVYAADEEGFWTRQVTSQTTAKFGRDGRSRWVEGGGSCTIVSTARLPSDLYDLALGLDRKIAARPEYPESRLSKDEVRLVLTHDKFFKAHLLPGTESIVIAAEKVNSVRHALFLEWDLIDALGNPPKWDEYLSDLPALVDLLDKRPSADLVADFLAGMASRRNRALEVAGRGKAASLLRLAQGWV